MNVSQANHTPQKTATAESSQNILTIIGSEEFLNHLNLAQQGTEWYTKTEVKSDKERENEEQQTKRRKAEDLEDDLVVGLTNQVYFSQQKQLEAIESDSKILGADRKARTDAKNLEKNNLHTPAVTMDGEDKSAENTFTKMMAGELKEAQTGQPGKETLTHPGKPETDESGKAGRNPLLKPGESVNGDLTQRFDASLVRGLNTATVAKTGIKFQEKGIAELSRLSSLESDIGKNSGNRPTARIASLSNIAGENSLANRGAQGGLKAETTAGKASTPVNIKDVVGRVKIMISSKTNEMVMKLSPEHLGKLEIQLKKEGDKMIGRFTVDNLQAKKALEAELPQLKHALTEQGIHIEEFTVTLNSDDGSNSSFAFNHREGGDTGHSRDTGAMDNETRSGSPVAGNKGSSIQRNASGLNIYV